MHNAAIAGDADITHALIAAGADLDAENEDKMTALSYAAWQNEARIVTLLVAAKADFECVGSIPGLKRTGMKPIHMASRKGSKKEPKIDSVHALILAKACVTCQDDSGSTPLMYAAAGGDECVVKMLLDANASLNMNVAKMTSGGETALHLAAAYDVLVQVTMKNICFSYSNPSPLDLEYVGACRPLLPLPHSAHTQVQLHSH